MLVPFNVSNGAADSRIFILFLTFSCLLFLLRHLEHSTIIYEDPQRDPLLRLGWNKQDPNYLATFAMDAIEVLTYHVIYTGLLYHF